MKKTLLVLFLAAGIAVSASAQTEREKGVYNKKGYHVLPQKGDFAIGIDATPFFDYVIGLLEPADAPTFEGYNGSLYGKYFLTDRSAVRLRFNVGVLSNKTKYKVQDDEGVKATPPILDATTYDSQTVNGSSFGLFGGYEYRRGYGRLQGYVGGEFGLFFTTRKYEYEWGNAMTMENPRPSSAPAWAPFPESRTMWLKEGSTFGLQLGAFVGVEFFIARKISMGGELALNLKFSSSGQSMTEVQTFNALLHRVELTEQRYGTNGGGRSWDFRTPVKGNIFFMFHF